MVSAAIVSVALPILVKLSQSPTLKEKKIIIFSPKRLFSLSGVGELKTGINNVHAEGARNFLTFSCEFSVSLNAF